MTMELKCNKCKSFTYHLALNGSLFLCSNCGGIFDVAWPWKKEGVVDKTEEPVVNKTTSK